ncbi:Two-component system sensor histidine kinase/response regulator hybrid [hydrothermal vent metagenome]|uniref:Two-component system sensor histidine kinase/response regulator hybrid n=1 Tax=hydrothermal vent metagenome TaxID=652676 RepID=A0A3B1BDJ1_9ZZZZ
MGVPVRLTSHQGQPLFEEKEIGVEMMRAPLRNELEIVGFLEAAAPVERLMMAVGLVELLVQSGRRYLMTSTLHLQTIADDYKTLQQEHAELLKSEAKYRELTQRLEQRVEEQVSVIETAQRRLYENEKLVSVGQLAAGVAHEINTPIGFVMSNLSSARSYLETIQKLAGAIRSKQDVGALQTAWEENDMDFILDDFDKLMGESIGGIERVASIVADLRGFSGIDRGQEFLRHPPNRQRKLRRMALP